MTLIFLLINPLKSRLPASLRPLFLFPCLPSPSLRHGRQVFLFLISSLQLQAGNDNLCGGPRALAMANTAVCLDDVWSARNNPAALAPIKQTGAATAFENPYLLRALSIAGVALDIPTRAGTFGLAVSSFGSPLYRENNSILSFGKKLGARVSAGVGITYLNTVIGEGYGTQNGVSADAGLLVSITKNIKLGIHLINPTRAQLAHFSDERYPTTLQTGAAYTLSPFLLFCVEAEKDNLHPPVFRAGMEYAFLKQFFLRAGVSGNPALVCMGFGLRIGSLKMDFASSWHPVIGFYPGVGLAYNLSRS
jgi:hypothetical protein